MRNKVVILSFVAAMGLALVVGIFIPRAGRSALPEFDSAEFASHGPSGRSLVRLNGAKAQRLRPIFDEVPQEWDPQKWVSFGHLTLFEKDKEVLHIQVLSGPGGEGPFGIKGKGDYLGYDEAALKALLTDFGWQPDPVR